MKPSVYDQVETISGILGDIRTLTVDEVLQDYKVSEKFPHIYEVMMTCMDFSDDGERKNERMLIRMLGSKLIQVANEMIN